MTKARYLKASALEQLREEIPENLEHYRLSHSFDRLLEDGTLSFEIDVKIDVQILEELLVPTEGQLFEVENCLAVFNALSQLTPYDARDERLWTFLCHTHGMAYVKARWPIPDDDAVAVKHIRTHFFAKSSRQIERDNALSRLWWMSFLCHRVNSMSVEDALQALLYRTDVRAQIIERPTMIQNSHILGAILEKLAHSLRTDKQLFERDINRRFIQELNAVGGFKLLDMLSVEQLRSLIDALYDAAIAEVAQPK